MSEQDLSKEFPWARFHSLDYPLELNALAAVLTDVRAVRSLIDRANPATLGNQLIGDSTAIQLVRTLIEQVAPSLATVLITGESGTGKEVVARQIHELSGRDGPFVAINCGAIPESLLESELFGHEKGAFTGATSARSGRFEQAKGGTFFLDEIGDMPTVMQVKLLRVLEERIIERVGGNKRIPVDVRVIAATHRDLPQRIESGKFREDLYYRLSVFPIEVARLSDRVDDIPPLIDEFLKRQTVERPTSIRIADDAMEALQCYSWAGNVRELANLIERLTVLKPGGVIHRDDLPWPIVEQDQSDPNMPKLMNHTFATIESDGIATLPADGLDLKQYLANVEQNAIRGAIEESVGVVQRAAELLGVRRTTLIEKIKRYGIEK